MRHGNASVYKRGSSPADGWRADIEWSRVFPQGSAPSVSGTSSADGRRRGVQVVQAMSPDESRQLSGDGRDDRLVVLAVLHQGAMATAQPFLCRPEAFARVVGGVLRLALQMPRFTRGESIGPGTLGEDATHHAVARLRDGTGATAAAAAELTRHQAEVGHELRRVAEPTQIADFRQPRDRGQVVDATQRPEGIHQRAPFPRGGVRQQIMLQRGETALLIREGRQRRHQVNCCAGSANGRSFIHTRCLSVTW